MLSQISNWLSKAPKTILIFISLALVLLIGVLDYWTGYEMSLALFYLVPVSFAAWYVGRCAGIAVSLISGAVWEVSNDLAGQTFSSPLFYAWNMTSRIVVFSLTAILLCKLHAVLEHERELSRTDPLTGVMNRRAFQEEFARELHRAQRYELPLTLAFIDLDNFKAMNDQFGHSAGDTVLCTVAGTIDRVIRDTDIAARLGGDEFGIVLTNTGSVGAKKALTKIHTHLHQAMEQLGWAMTFSIGAVACPPLCSATVEELFGEADEIMYSVKKTGKDAIQVITYTG